MTSLVSGVSDLELSARKIERSGRIFAFPGLKAAVCPRKAFPTLITFCGFYHEAYLKRLGLHKVNNKARTVSCYYFSSLALLPVSTRTVPPAPEH